jgi:hypothetical protein
VDDPRIIVQRRFPTYDFVLITSAEPGNASALLEAFRARGPVTGEVSGHRFRLRCARSGMARALAFNLEGSFVPSVAGSNVHVRVHAPLLVWAVRWLLSVAGAVALAVQIDLEEIMPALQMAALLLVITSLLMRDKVDDAMRMLEAVFPAA